MLFRSSLLSLTLSGEHWSSEESEDDDGCVKTASTINLKPSKIKISDLYINEDGSLSDTPVGVINNDSSSNVFELAAERYRKLIRQNQVHYQYKHLDYIYVDVWEDVDNFDGSLQKLEKEEDIINYINYERKKEMIGLMSLYPNEWPYRDEDAYDEVCGSNIAIDTDDLILLNSSICIVFGTYGRRSKSAATDWADHLKIRNSYFVSWPEYMLILEMVLAKKYTIAAAKDFLLKATNFDQNAYSIRQSIERNAAIELPMTQLYLKLDTVND